MLFKKRYTTIILLIILFTPVFSADNNSHAWDGSRTAPVHRIPLLDENNRRIIPTEPYPLPFSARFTCAPCHDYDKIAAGLHFGGSLVQAESGRPGEPWFLIDRKSGTVLPVAAAKWPNTWNLKEAGLTPWDFTLHFGRHMTGGGTSEPGEEVSPGSRWDVSGALEINCMGCHNASRIQSHSEWAKQVLRQNFRWAATAASALGEVGGMASRLSATWDIYDGPNLDDPVYAVVPSVKYDKTRFDSKHRVFFDIRRRPEDERCLTCHSVSVVGAKKFDVDGDVHSLSGLKCVQCHRHGIDHKMTRGCEGETAGQDSDFSCRGCHSGISRGRLGAPRLLHKGIPALHFEKLSCTVCHSGPLPGKRPVRMRTSRANRLGIFGVAQWFTETPHIAAPVYIKGSDGKIAPHRLVWPAFWAQLAEGEVTPLPAEIIREVGKDILYVEERIAALLLTLMQNLELQGEPVLATSGKVFRRSADGLLQVSSLPAEAGQDTFLAVNNKEKIEPLVPVFDTTAEQLDVEIETRITMCLETLNILPEKLGEPVLVYKNKLYFLLEGYLEVKELPGKQNKESPGEPARNPELCWLTGDKITPLFSPFELRTIAAIVGSEQSLTEEQVRLILKKLKENLPPAAKNLFEKRF
ncbi:MAG: hypothetical protein KAW12_22610, partial [Candidatus Aminicenantes bacterium]|nr:hypothetical protein [Candidatus Aminicenantes bacterium]